MEATTTKRTRRSHWQVLASKKLRYSDFMGGDGPHIVLSKCGRRWKYWLFDHWHDALTKSLHRCGDGCANRHNTWELRDE